MTENPGANSAQEHDVKNWTTYANPEVLPVMKQGVALITGASAGIGMEFARILAAEKYDLVLVARRKQALQQLAQELKNQHKELSIEIITADLSDPKAPQTVFNTLRKKKLKINVLINNAGFGTNGAFAELNLKKELNMLDLNIRSLVEMTGLFLPDMLRYKEGLIINVASTAAFQPGPYMANYYASKAHVLHFSEAIAHELRGTGVKVSALCPGPTATEFFQVAGMEHSALNKGKFTPVLSARRVAEIGWKKAKRGKVIVITGFMNRLLVISTRFAPRFLVRTIAGWLNNSGKDRMNK